MTAVLTAPVESLTKTDVESVIGWPEGLRLEFKKDLPSKKGRDSWYHVGDIGEKAKTAIFNEIVAFANTSGGRLIIGVDQSADSPPIAIGLSPLPRCAELAERLERSASASIDPPIPLLRIVGVSTDNAGNGVVIAHVPASHAAPHRSNNLECYIRRGANSVRISMREIQNVTLQLSRRGDEIANRFSEARTAFHEWLPKEKPPTDRVLGIRVTAVPVGAPLYVGRIFANRSVLVGVKEFKATVGNALVKLAPLLPGALSEHPLVRGSRRERRGSVRSGYYDVYCDGVIDLCAKLQWQNPSENRIYLGWISNHIANVMLAAETFAGAAGAGDAEYGIEIELTSYASGGDAPPVLIEGFFPNIGVGPVGTLYVPVVLPRVGFGPKDAALNIILQDVLDACGCTDELPGLSIGDWRGVET